jgi:hypothetical protein
MAARQLDAPRPVRFWFRFRSSLFDHAIAALCSGITYVGARDHHAYES